MRKGLFFSAFVAAMLASGLSYSQPAADSYPSRKVRVVVPYPAGGPADLIGRILAQKLGQRLGASFYVENISGASGAVATGQVAQAAPDGYTLLVTTNDFAVNSVTNSNLPYDPIKNFSPVTIVAASPQVVAANPSFPAKTMKELVDVIRAAPDKYSYASLGIGFGQLSAERLFKLGLKLDKLVRVPFNGAAPAVNSTLAGDTQVIFLGLPPVAPHLQSDKLRAIAVTSHQRSKQFPDVPTLTEAGVPNQESDLQIGLVAPAGTPAPVIAKLQHEISEIVKLPDVKSSLETVSFHAVASSPSDYARQIKDDIAVWGKVMKDANIPVN
ncbi:MAG TPA: tripartite tricarboxylate transporter substrate-binding protein [Xanthobacteraceae bacterium]|nr:tripartite tricarboxylate transporter substrate-binding protein [Xanthobacteraceae bacterium]